MQGQDIYRIRGSGSSSVWQRAVPILFAFLTVKFALAWCFPLIGDEAYLSLWGKYVACGYYDHPPVVGWLLYLLRHIVQSPVLLRLPPILFSAAVGMGIYILLRPYDESKAYLVFLLFMLSPFNAAFFVVTTDSPLFLFSFLSAFLLFKAERDKSYLCYFISGVFLGLAFLSKYFAILLGLSYLVYLLWFPIDARKVKGFILIALGTLPFVTQNIVWNYQTGWPNIMHNLFNRFGRPLSPVVNLFIMCVSLTYLINLPVLYFLFKNRAGIIVKLQKENFRVFTVVSLLPLFVFLVVSLKRPVGPHWYLSFVPLAYIMVALLLDHNQIVRSVKISLVFSLVQVSLTIAASFVPLQWLKELVTEDERASLILYMRPKKVLAQLEGYKSHFILATTSYSKSAILEYYGSDRVIVFGRGSNHGRQDDMLTNFKELDGRNILILYKASPYDVGYRWCFERMETKDLTVEGAKFTLLLGYSFKYQEYRDKYLRLVLHLYYQVPDWLPGSGSFFHKKYDF